PPCRRAAAGCSPDRPRTVAGPGSGLESWPARSGSREHQPGRLGARTIASAPKGVKKRTIRASRRLLAAAAALRGVEIRAAAGARDQLDRAGLTRLGARVAPVVHRARF